MVAKKFKAPDLSKIEKPKENRLPTQNSIDAPKSIQTDEVSIYKTPIPKEMSTLELSKVRRSKIAVNNNRVHIRVNE